MAESEARVEKTCINSHVARIVISAIFFGVILTMMGVHVYYATSALLDVLTDFILFTTLTFFGLSTLSLLLCAQHGPGPLPSRFTGARMDTFIRTELQRLLQRAAAAPTAIYTETRNQTDATRQVNDTDAAKAQQRYRDMDNEENHALANEVSTVAMSHRASPTMAAQELERRAAEARLGMHPLVLTDSDADDSGADHTRTREGGAAVSGEAEVVVQVRPRRDDENTSGNEEDGAAAGSELPAYMTEVMQQRRQRKVRRGLEVVRVSTVARRLLQAMDGGDLDRKQEEMRYLLPGANWCRFCNFYQMNDTRHCQACGRCVYRFKMHALLCGCCVGPNNSKFYILFLFYLILALLMADLLDLYCINWGYTHFFGSGGDINRTYYFSFVYSAMFATIIIVVLANYLYAAGRNVGLLTHILRQQREELAAVRESNSGAVYELILAENTADAHDDGSSSPDQAPEAFQWRRALNEIGEGLPLPLWFFLTPTQPTVKETDDPADFWENLKEAIRLRLRSLADEDDIFMDDEAPLGETSVTTPVPVPAAVAVAVAPIPVSSYVDVEEMGDDIVSPDAVVEEPHVSPPPAARFPPPVATAPQEEKDRE